MPFVNEILKYKSLAIVGLEKNTGKTECLNYVLKNIHDKQKKLAVTSIGVDGETVDAVTFTKKPEIIVYEGMLFVTSEKHFKEKQLTANILDILNISTPLGRLVIAEAVDTGKIRLSGPSITTDTVRVIERLNSLGTELTIVDGALSRLSLSSPTVTDAMILATGAALSANIPTLVRQTKFVVDLINLPLTKPEIREKLADISGVCAVTDDNEIKDLGINSVFTMNKEHDDVFKYGYTIYSAGAVNDKFLKMLKIQKHVAETTLIVNDFTKIFAEPETYYSFLRKGGKIEVVHKTKLLALTLNPWAPNGYSINSEEARNQLFNATQIPVYDVKE